MARLPFGEDLLDRFAGLAFKLCINIGHQWTARTMRTNRSCQGMIECLLIDTHCFDLFLGEPLTGFAVEARRIGEIRAVIAIVLVPAAVDDHDISGLDLGLGTLKVFWHNLFPLALRNRDNDSRTEE